MAEVFISYKREERAAAERIEGALRDLGVDVWRDRNLTPGLSFVREIEQQLEAAGAVLVCWSPASIKSSWVRREAAAGLRKNILVGAQVRSCRPPRDFRNIHATDLSKWSGAFDDPDWLRVVDRLSQLIAKPALVRNSKLRAGGQRPEMVGMLRRLLVEKARGGGRPFTYEEAADALALSAKANGIRLGDFDQPVLWGALDGLAAANRDAREPPLFALVVKGDTGRPGRGYFQKHAFLSDDRDPMAISVFERHLELVRSHGWPKD